MLTVTGRSSRSCRLLLAAAAAAAACCAANCCCCALVLAVATNCAEIYSTKSLPYCLHVALLFTHPATIGRAKSSVVHPPHFGCAQRKITELQLPKSAVGAFAPAAIVRLFIIEFQLLLLADAFPPFHAVKLLPAVVAIWADATHGMTHKINKNTRLNSFIFSLRLNFITNPTLLKAKKIERYYPNPIISEKIKDNGIDTHEPDIVVYMALHEMCFCPPRN